MRLAVLESDEGNRERCLHWLRVLESIKDDPSEVQKRIDEVERGESLDPDSGGI